MAPKTAVAFFLVSAMALGLGVYARMQDTAPADPLLDGRRPQFSLPDLSGRMRSISEWDGQVVVLNFWATWCAPCIKEIPEFVQLQDEYGADGVQFIGVAIDDLDPVNEFVKDFEVDYPILIGKVEAAGLSGRFGNDLGALPYTAVIDRDGQVVFTRRGLLDRASAEAAIERALVPRPG